MGENVSDNNEGDMAPERKEEARQMKLRYKSPKMKRNVNETTKSKKGMDNEEKSKH